MENILIYGAGGHARVIIDIIEKAKTYKVIGIVDDTGLIKRLMGYQVERDIRNYLDIGISKGLVAIGDNWQRNFIAMKILSKCKNFKFVSAIHPSVRIARDVVIGEGTVVMAGCNINPCVTLGNHCIVNTGTNIDHDCTINDYSSLAPGVTLGGNVIIGEYAAIGLGTSVIHKIMIGTHAVVGAGSVIVKNIPSNCVAYGNPCKFVRNREIDETYL